MVHIGFTTKLIALNVIVVFLVGMIFNIPAGILADRWSRKGMVMLASTSLGLATLLLSLSSHVWEYLVASILYGLYFALYDGTFNAMIYDTVLDETKSRDGYESYIGYAGFIESIALVIASLFGGLIGSRLGLSVAYFLSLPGCILSIIALSYFREPLLHKKQNDVTITNQIRSSSTAVFHSRYLVWVLITIVVSVVLCEFLSELDQLWLLALHLKLIYYGPLNALLLLGYGLGGVVAGHVMKRSSLYVVLALFGILCTCLLIVRSMPIIAVAQFGVLLVFTAIDTIAIGALHDRLPTAIRSGSASVISTLSGLVFIPYVLLFSSVAEHFSVFLAARLLIPIACIAAIGMLYICKHRRKILSIS